jgi:hypothetical protein
MSVTAGFVRVPRKVSGPGRPVSLTAVLLLSREYHGAAGTMAVGDVCGSRYLSGLGFTPFPAA